MTKTLVIVLEERGHLNDGDVGSRSGFSSREVISITQIASEHIVRTFGVGCAIVDFFFLSTIVGQENVLSGFVEDLHNPMNP